MNARRTAIALAIIGLLATTITAQAALVWSDNFNSYTPWDGVYNPGSGMPANSSGALPGQGTWVQPTGYYGAAQPLRVVTDPTGSGMGNVVDLGNIKSSDNGAGIALPSSFASFGPTDIGVQHARVLTFKIYSNTGWETLIPVIRLWQGTDLSQGAYNKTEDLSLRLSGNTYDYSGITKGTFYDQDSDTGYLYKHIGADVMTLTPDTWQTVTAKIYLTYANNAKIELSLDGVLKGTLDKAYNQSGGGYNYLQLYYYSPSAAFMSSAYGIYVDNIQAFDDAVVVPEPSTALLVGIGLMGAVVLRRFRRPSMR
jgi:hypothetical protein